MTGEPIDLRSDTVTRPTPAMRRAMAEAEVGDDAFGEDPTVRTLEEESARALGKEAALFVPSGTMGNQIAIALHARPGEEVILDHDSHVALYELGGVAALWGAMPRALRTREGIPSVDQLREVHADGQGYEASRTALIVVENTHMRHGGIAHSAAAMEPVLSFAREHFLATHLDGARIFNAAAALGVPARTLAAEFATATFCFSKGLGAPVGSCLCGTSEAIREARRIRKRLGGGMRQAGVIAAAALHGLRHHAARLGEDHARARRLAAAIAQIPGLAVRPSPPPTNMVMVRLTGGPERPEAYERLRERLESEGVLAFTEGLAVRLVTHLGIDDGAIDGALLAVRRAAAGLGPAGAL